MWSDLESHIIVQFNYKAVLLSEAYRHAQWSLVNTNNTIVLYPSQICDCWHAWLWIFFIPHIVHFSSTVLNYGVVESHSEVFQMMCVSHSTLQSDVIQPSNRIPTILMPHIIHQSHLGELEKRINTFNFCTSRTISACRWLAPFCNWFHYGLFPTL